MRVKDPDFVKRYGPVAVVTGASSGIGRSFADALAAKGLNLLLVARRKQRLEELSSTLAASHGVEAKVCQVDLSQPTAAQEILDASASFDVGLVMSNAGFGLKGAYDSGDPRTLTDML